VKRTLLLLALVATACGDAPTTTRARKAEPTHSGSKPAKTLAKATPSEPPGPLPSGPGPLPVADDELVRRSAVLAVLAGGSAATTLPERAADPDHPFDPNLASAMTPTAGSTVPQIRHGDITVDGDLPVEIVRRIARRYFGQLRSCYEAQLQRDAKALGTLQLTFTIGPQGTLTASEASSTAFDTMLSTCIEGGLKRWRFPPPKDGNPVQVKFAVELSPR